MWGTLCWCPCRSGPGHVSAYCCCISTERMWFYGLGALTDSVIPLLSHITKITRVRAVYKDEEGRNKDDKSKTKTQTRTQSSSLIGPGELSGSMLLERICPAVPDWDGMEAVTRVKQNATYHEMGRLSRNVSEGECGVSE